MIYFKFPHDEKLNTVDGNPDTEAVTFHSFDQSEKIGFKGKIITLNEENDLGKSLTEFSLSKDRTEFVEETKEEYLIRLSQIIDVVKENNLPKLVLSRRKIFKDFISYDLKLSFKNLCTSYPNAFRYIFLNGENSWIGAFSEVLGKFNKVTNEFETMSLAGTLPLSENWSDKETEEQKPVSAYIRNILEKFKKDSEIEESETYNHISGNIKHLRTDFKLKINPADLDDIIADLHPTPAVCGIPKDFCKEKITEYEKFPRELYAGFIRIETDNFIQYFVNLRCARLYSDCVHVFVGGGITAKSDPEKEWRETELKSQAVIGNLHYSN